MSKSKKFNPIGFLSQVKVELSLVSWPSRQDALRLTAMVIVISIIIASYLGALDATFISLFKKLIKN